MVAEDVERACGKRTRRNVEHGGKQLARDFIHIGDHEQQTLGRGVSGGQRARGQRTVHGARSAAFGLHFRYAERLSEHVEPTLRRPLIRDLRHGRRGRDGINGSYFGKRIRYVRRRGISVDSHFFHLELFLRYNSWYECRLPSRSPEKRQNKNDSRSAICSPTIIITPRPFYVNRFFLAHAKHALRLGAKSVAFRV